MRISAKQTSETQVLDGLTQEVFVASGCASVCAAACDTVLRESRTRVERLQAGPRERVCTCGWLTRCDGCTGRSQCARSRASLACVRPSGRCSHRRTGGVHYLHARENASEASSTAGAPVGGYRVTRDRTARVHPQSLRAQCSVLTVLTECSERASVQSADRNVTRTRRNVRLNVCANLMTRKIP